MVQSFSTGGVDAFLKPENQQAPVPAIYPIERFSPNVKALNLPLAADGAQPDFDGLYKNYNYELFYHLPVYAAKTLTRTPGNGWSISIRPLPLNRLLILTPFRPLSPAGKTPAFRRLLEPGCLRPYQRGDRRNTG